MDSPNTRNKLEAHFTMPQRNGAGSPARLPRYGFFLNLARVSSYDSIYNKIKPVRRRGGRRGVRPTSFLKFRGKNQNV
jgi:hypothetical protein